MVERDDAVRETLISADSHVTEPPGTYVDRIASRWRDEAPRLRDLGGELGDVFVIDGLDLPVPMGLVAAAGRPAEQIRMMGVRFEDLHRSGWDPTARRRDQLRDGVAAEILYPTVGMVLCNHPDFDYKKACFDAYNEWIAEYCSADPLRLIGLGQTAMRSPEEGVEDLRRIRRLGLRGVMMPGHPAVEDYDSPRYDDFWRAAVDLELPLSFHILTTRPERGRGCKLTSFLSVVRGCQDILAMLVLGGVFERHPRLRVVCAEADAGWVPHFLYRMDHAFKRHRHWLPPGQELSRLPSEYFSECVSLTFQDDWVAFRSADQMDWRRLMWANDFPHSDSTWPDSQPMLARHGAGLAEEQRRAIFGGNAAELYGLDLGALSVAG